MLRGRRVYLWKNGGKELEFWLAPQYCTYKYIDTTKFDWYAVFCRRAMRFTWDENKNRQNLRTHHVRFETAVLVFDDPYAITQRDVTFEDEERWITVGAIGPGSILLVVHTFYEEQRRSHSCHLGSRRRIARKESL